MSKMAGGVWDEIDAIGTDATKSTEGNSLNMASDGDKAAYAEIAKPIRDKVLAEVSAKGIDANAAVEFIAKEMSSYGK